MTATPAKCDVWWADPAWASPVLLDLLDEHERARHARFRLAADRDRYVVAHALVRMACAREAGCAPEEVTFSLHCRSCTSKPDGPGEPHGKPRPEGPARGLEVSLSHSGDRVGVALARGTPVGVDVERLSDERDIDGIAKYALTENERAALEPLSPEARVDGFFGYWARKEALLKATGDGLSAGLTTIGVSRPDQPAELEEWNAPGAPEHAWLSDLDVGPGYRAALAALSPGPLTVASRDAAPLLLGR